MSTDKHRTGATSDTDALLNDALRRILEQAPAAFAVTRGTTHALVYTNAAFRALPGTVRPPAHEHPIGDMFEATVAARMTAFFDRALREDCALRDRFLGPLETGNKPWSCAVWPLAQEAEQPPQGLVIELYLATATEVALSLQREVAERLLLSALRVSDAAEGAEALHQRAAFLATASRHLAGSLDTDITRQTVAGLTLPPLAEWCIVDLLEEDNLMHRLTIIHRDPRKQALVSQLDGRWSPQSGDPFGVPAVLNNAQPVLITEVDEALRAAAHGPENLRVLHDLGIGPLLTVPLITDKRVTGAITFLGGAGETGFTSHDVEFAESLAARSALALESARMYGQTILLKDRAEAASRYAATFLGTISHELRTPLNAISGYVEVIALGIHGPVTDKQRVDLERISSNQKHLLVLVGELLNYMRVGSGRVHRAAVDVLLEEAGTRAVEALEPLIVNKGISWNVLVPGSAIVATADPDCVHQILVNLISNAVKFTNEGGEITIDCSTAEDTVSITVKDNGRGIPSDMRELIFEPFVQAQDDDAKKYGGLGLGLPISRDLARAMHGDLTVESTFGKTSSFTLTLPARVEEVGGADLELL